MAVSAWHPTPVPLKDARRRSCVAVACAFSAVLALGCGGGGGSSSPPADSSTETASASSDSGADVTANIEASDTSLPSDAADASSTDASGSSDAPVGVDRGDSGVPEDAGEATDGVTDAPCGTLDAPTEGGTLILQAFGGASGEVAAQVPLLEPGAGPQQTCTGPLDAGACQLTFCQFRGVGSPGGGYGNFGPLSASVGTTTVPITYNGTGYGTVYFPPSITLGTGGTMTFHGGNGCGVPTFNVSATIPGLAVITSPVPTTDGGAAIIDTAQDLPVTWSPISIGQIQFGLGGALGSTGGITVSIACTFEGASGSGVVPHALLASLKEMSGSTYGSLSSELEATTVVDGLTIVTQSYQDSPTTGSGFNVTLQ